MEIEVGEYVRTIHGEIAIFKGWNNNPKSQWSCKLEFQKNKTWKYCCEEYIKSHSTEIIGLIGVGDYVNGYKVVDIMEDMKIGELHLEMTSDYTNQEIGDCTIYNKDIKTIVTHEQFAEMEYKVNE